jgi:hypothetical protein
MSVVMDTSQIEYLKTRNRTGEIAGASVETWWKAANIDGS